MFKKGFPDLSFWSILVSILILILVSIFTLNSIARFLFPFYFFYLAFGIFLFVFFLKIDFRILKAFSNYFYLLSLIFLVLPIFFGQITRGAIRWIQIGNITLQPSELVKPFLLLFFAKLISEKELNFYGFFKVLFLFLIPFFLILFQPSLGVAFLLAVGFLGQVLASRMRKIAIFFIFFSIILLPLVFFFLLPYQKQRIIAFINPSQDPLGVGYNSIQAMITVGAGKIIGRGLGKGTQSQLLFLPERHSDFIFATVAEELGLLGSLLIFLPFFIFFWVLTSILKNTSEYFSRLFLSGSFLMLLTQFFIHIGMNMGILPITGIPLPFVSAGGSSLISSLLLVSLILNLKRSS